MSRRVEDYPQDLAAFDRFFPTEDACRAYLVRLRWPDGFRCPACGHGTGWPVRSVLFECAACGRQTSVTAGVPRRANLRNLRESAVDPRDERICVICVNLRSIPEKKEICVICVNLRLIPMRKKSA